MKGRFSTPVCARKQTNGPPALTRAFLQAAASATNSPLVLETSLAVWVFAFYVSINWSCMTNKLVH